jgi:uncharacterized membrane protein YkvA (DUF1232 family)
MKELRVTFRLQEEDLEHLRSVLRAARAATRGLDDEEIAKAALRQAETARAARPPGFVLERIDTLQTLAVLLMDQEWALPQSARTRVRSALAYFAQPDGALISNQVPVVGFLDDALMIELVAQEFRDEIDGYRDFCERRGAAVRRFSAAGDRAALDRALATARKKIRARLQERRDRARERGSLPVRLFRLW